ncbi:MAG TPA: FG-GAP-like repeat-containing protein [Puia sp.]
MPKKADTLGAYPHFVVFGDLNQDGKPDLVVSRGSSGVVDVLTNASTGGSIVFSVPLGLTATGTDHEGAAVGDLDGDGKPDIVLTNAIDLNSISLFRNTGSGGVISFSGAQDLAVVDAPYSVAIGDLDGDGKPDLAVANNGGTQISLFRNTSTQGNFSFAPRVDLTVGLAPYGVAIGDLDGDGKADLVVSTQGTGAALYAVKNLSTVGAFSFGTPIGIASGSGFTVAIGDLDGDGKPDIAEAAAAAIIVVRNESTTGSLVFGGAQNFYTASYAVGVVIADLDADGKADLICPNRFTNNISAFHNTGSSGTISFAAHVEYDVDADPLSVAVADLDGDSRPDIAVANSAAPTISVLRNIIGANIAPEVTGFTPAHANSGGHVTITGVNLGGATAVSFGGVAAQSFTGTPATSVDAVVGVGASGNVSVTTPYGVAALGGFTYDGPLISGFTPTIGLAGTVVTINGSNLTGATAVSFGGVAAASFTLNSPNQITATVGAGASGAVMVTTPMGSVSFGSFVFGVPTITDVSPGSGAVGSSVVLSGTNFGATPAANTVYFGGVPATVTAASTGSLTVTVPTGAAYQPVSVTTNGLTAYSSKPFSVSFTVDSPTITNRSFAAAVRVRTGYWPRTLAAGDLDGDGKVDVVTGNANDNSLSVLLNTSVPGAVAFAPAMSLPTGPDVIKVAMGDIDGDGKLDLVEVNFNNGNASSFSVYRNTSVSGALSFAPRVDYPTGNGSTDVVLADMNGDGKTDILVPSGNSAIWSIYLNRSTAGVIAFDPAVSYTALGHAENLAVTDLDNDGKPDVVITNFSSSDISVYRNQSSGGVLSMGVSTDYDLAEGANATFVATADLDGDGKPDVGVSNYSLNTVSLFRNTSTAGNVTLFLQQNLTHPPTTLSFADINGDGKVDLCSGEMVTGKLSVFQNTSAAVGLFSFNNNVDLSPGSLDVFTAVADVDGDGKPDLLAVAADQNSLVVYRNRMGDPSIHSVVPDSAEKGQTVTINGSGFTGVVAVSAGGAPVDHFTVVDAKTIRAVVGNGNSGSVAVRTASGNDSLGGFHFIPQISPNGPVVACGGASVILGSTAGSGNQWYKDGTMLAGDTAAILTATASGVYSVRVTTNGITMAADSSAEVNILSGAAPVITRNANNDLVSSDTTGNQWMLNGTPIPGATDVRYHPTQTGSYTVQATIAGCTTDVSDPYSFVASGLIDLGNGQFVSLYPNPVKNSLNVYWNINGNPTLDVVISDLEGRQMLTVSHVSNGTVLDLTGLPRGVYNVKIYSSDSYKINKTARILKVD